jgi:beta-glucosidase
MGLDHYRFSLEWSRIEPAPGEWSIAALDHYRRLCDYLRDQNIDPVVTLHHFTTPTWLADEGGWEKETIVDRFAEFCHRSTAALADSARRICTLNEPNVVATMGYVMGMFPPGRTDPGAAKAVTANLVAAHSKAVEAVRAAAPGLPVGLTLSMTDYQAVEGGEERTAHIREIHEDVFLEATAGDDFLGVQTYTRMRIGPDGWAGPEPGVPVLPMGYELWPDALAACLRRAWGFTGGKIPLWVTENGIGTDDDAQRVEFVSAALRGVLGVISEGIDVRGYAYWSLLDNFEWAFGYRPHFGLVQVDRKTFERRPKPSAAWLSEVARANRLPE